MQDPPPRERPWLLPSNRKLRHLQGITLRNLALPARSRGKTAAVAAAAAAADDDDALPSALKSPAKALALYDAAALAHSRSSDDLTRRRPKAMRRRSTLEWTTASPLTRQQRLEDIAAGRMADAFFSLHTSAHADPVYISEVADRAMNPNFKFFDLAPCGPSVTRLDTLTVRLWARREATHAWHFLLDCTVHLASLHFIGKTLGSFRHPLPPNCLLFHMTDGIYTTLADLPVHAAAAVAANSTHALLAPPKENPDGRIATSSSYDALMRLSTLDDCIQDALVTRDRIADEIETILQANRHALSTVDRVPEADEKTRTVQAAVTAEHRRVLAVRRRRDELAASIRSRREKMHAGRDQAALVASELPTRTELCNETTDAIDATEEAIAGQRRRICEDLLTIYPIDPLPAKSLAFTVRGLLLPNSRFDDADPDVTAAALGHVAQLLTVLSPYFSFPLPYPLSPHGSTSTIDDPLATGHATANNPRTYPLYTRGVVRYRFEYAVFLLNKNIEMLSNALGIRPLDIRQTLPNLKYLLYVATAGEGELPARKAGGIKGLLRHHGFASRKASIDSASMSSVGDVDTLKTTLPQSRLREGVVI